MGLQMALIARIQHPYIVEFKEAWVEKVSQSPCFFPQLGNFAVDLHYLFFCPELEVVLDIAGLLCLHRYWVLRRRRHVSFHTFFCPDTQYPFSLTFLKS